MKQSSQHILGHTYALIVSLIWGLTFIASKILLTYYTPMAIMVIRFTLAYVVLWLFHPKVYKPISIKDELNYLMAGFTGVAGYFLLENTAIVYTTVSNVGLLLASAPLFVAIVLHIFQSDESFHLNLLYGFIIAMIGCSLIIFNGQVNLEVSPLGDTLAILAAFVWAFYSLSLKRMTKERPTIFHTRRTFFYGLLISYPLIMMLEGGFSLEPLVELEVVLNMGLLGLFGSATCYILWGAAVKYIGANKTSTYIYLMPLFTMIASVIILDEVITGLMIVGCVFILLGVYLSEYGLIHIRKILKRGETL